MRPPAAGKLGVSPHFGSDGDECGADTVFVTRVASRLVSGSAARLHLARRNACEALAPAMEAGENLGAQNELRHVRAFKIGMHAGPGLELYWVSSPLWQSGEKLLLSTTV
ncbi:hypothetical protein EJB05_11426, partial [Eragrostis curvula]